MDVSSEMRWHPAACIFPMLPDDELQKLASDIRERGTHCFWRNRGKGPCSDTAECGHIWQNSRGGPMSAENCTIECRDHNNQRRDMGVEDYIKSPMTTASVSEVSR